MLGFNDLKKKFIVRWNEPAGTQPIPNQHEIVGAIIHSRYDIMLITSTASVMDDAMKKILAERIYSDLVEFTQTHFGKLGISLVEVNTSESKA